MRSWVLRERWRGRKVRPARTGLKTKHIMPTYDYVCEKCGREFEKFQSMNDARLTECTFDDCDGGVRRKIGTGAGIIFKGSGFYQTDYRSESYKSGEKKANEGNKKPEKKAEKKTESKPAAKKADS